MNSFNFSYYKPIMDMQDFIHIGIFSIYFIVVVKYFRRTLQNPITIVEKIDTSQNLDIQLYALQT